MVKGQEQGIAHVQAATCGQPAHGSLGEEIHMLMPVALERRQVGARRMLAHQRLVRHLQVQQRLVAHVGSDVLQQRQRISHMLQHLHAHEHVVMPRAVQVGPPGARHQGAAGNVMHLDPCVPEKRRVGAIAAAPVEHAQRRTLRQTRAQPGLDFGNVGMALRVVARHGGGIAGLEMLTLARVLGIAVVVVERGHLRGSEAQVQEQGPAAAALQRMAQGVGHAGAQVAQPPVGGNLQRRLAQRACSDERHEHGGRGRQVGAAAADAGVGQLQRLHRTAPAWRATSRTASSNVWRSSSPSSARALAIEGT